jgi:hypothetical protein
MCSSTDVADDSQTTSKSCWKNLKTSNRLMHAHPIKRETGSDAQAVVLNMAF